MRDKGSFPWLRRRFRWSNRSHDDKETFVFDKDGKIVAMCTLARMEGLSYGGRPFAIIENVVVDENERSQGIGKAVIFEAVKKAVVWNCYKVILETGSKLDWKLDFYERCGFTRGEKTAFLMKLK